MEMQAATHQIDTAEEKLFLFVLNKKSAALGNALIPVFFPYFDFNYCHMLLYFSTKDYYRFWRDLNPVLLHV